MPLPRPLALSALLLAVGLAGCSDPSEPELVGPDYEPGAGRLYPVRAVQFATADGVTVSGLLGAASGARGLPAVVLLHDLDGAKEAWISESSLFEQLLEQGYAVLAIDLRGFGQTALPGGREVAELADLEASFGDVQGALRFLAGRPEVDTLRVAVVGVGTGGNVAYVSKGVLGSRLRTAVCVSAGLWDRDNLQPAVVGAGLSPFAPASILFLVGAEDTIAVDGDGEIVLSYADFASGLAATTADPRSVAALPGSDAHGLALLSSEPAALGMVLAWLEQRL